MDIKMATKETEDSWGGEGGREARIEGLLGTVLSTWMMGSFVPKTSASYNITKVTNLHMYP